LAHESFDGNQAFRDRVNGEEQTFQSHRAEECRAPGGDEARCCHLLSVQRQPDLANGPNILLAPGNHNRLSSEGSDLKTLSHRARHDQQGGTRVHQ
jgi:hypothetical protein